MHLILEQQLRSLDLGESGNPPSAQQWKELLALVGASYATLEASHTDAEHLFEMRSLEMTDLFETLRKNTEDDLKKSTDLLDSIVEHIPAMIFVKEAVRLRFVRFNKAGEDLLGISREEILGRTDFELFPPAQAQGFVAKDRSVLENCELLDISEEEIETKNGPRWVHTKKIPLLDGQGKPVYLLGVSIDVTDRKNAELKLLAAHNQLEARVQERTQELQKQIEERTQAQESLRQIENRLRQAQKMEAIGQTAGGVAHDFNNILGVILVYAEMLLEELKEGDPLLRPVTEVKLAAERGAKLTKQLLAFSRQQILQSEIVDLRSVVNKMDGMLSRLIGENIQFLIQSEPDLWKIKADPGQLEQVLMNLVVNARDAMPQGGKISITLANRMLGPNDEDAAGRMGEHVLLEVRDTGSGMDEQTKSRIFEPFFTTKELGRGTGLGLSTVFGIVEQSKGWLIVDSVVGKGTVFRLYFPTCSDAPLVARMSIVDSMNLMGKETILFVEDQFQLRDVLTQVLTSYGYRVLSAGVPSEALKMAEEAKWKIDLLLTDVVLPEMNGRELAEKMNTQIPAMQVLFMSGYTDDPAMKHGVEQLGIHFLQKPFAKRALVERVRQLLDGPIELQKP